MIKTDKRFWDCECEKDFIHPKTLQKCKICGAEQKDQPDSRVNELRRYGFIHDWEYVGSWDETSGSCSIFYNSKTDQISEERMDDVHVFSAEKIEDNEFYPKDIMKKIKKLRKKDEK